MKSIKLIAFMAFATLTLNAQSLDEARKMLRFERYETAIQQLTPMSASSADAKYYLGLAQLGSGDTATAKATLSSIDDENYGKAGKAISSFLDGDQQAGMEQLNSLTKRVKRKEWLQYKLAGDATFLSDNQETFQKGIEWYNEALLKNPDPNIYVSQGDLYRKLSGKSGDAMTAYQTATRLDPNNSLSYSQQGKLWYDAKVYDSVLVLFNRAKEMDPENPLPYKYLAEGYQYIGNYDLAKQNIEGFLERSDKTVEDRRQYLNILFLAQDFEKVISVGESLLGTQAERPYMYRIIGESYLKTGNYDKAEEYFNTFFQKTDKDKILYVDYVDMALISLGKGDTTKAEEYYNKSLATLAPDSTKSRVMYEAAELYKEAKDYERAAYWYNKALPTSEHQKSDYFWAGYTNFYIGKYDEAITTLTEMQEKYPEEPLGFYWGGRAQMAKDPDAKLGTANESFKKFLTLTADDKSQKSEQENALKYLAAVSFNNGDKASAKDYVTQLLTLDPNNSWGQKMMANL